MKRLSQMSDIVKFRLRWVGIFFTVVAGAVTLVSFRDAFAASPALVKALQVQADQNTARISVLEKLTHDNAETLARIDERTKMIAERVGVRKRDLE